MRARASFVSLLICVFTSMSAQISQVLGVEHSDKPLKVTLDKRLAEQDYPVLSTPNPLTPNAQDPTPDDCRVLPSCDTIPLILEIPDELVYRLIVTTTFDHNAGDNDIDSYFWNDVFTTTPEGDREMRRSEMGRSATGAMPEVATFADLEPSSPDNVYWIVVNNFRGSSAYSIKAELVLPKFRSFDDESKTPRPRQLVSSTSKPSPEKPRSATALPQEVAPPGETFTVMVPGPDGELTEVPLTTIKGQAVEQRTPDRRPLIVIAIGILILGAATFVFFGVRGRGASSEATT